MMKSVPILDATLTLGISGEDEVRPVVIFVKECQTLIFQNKLVPDAVPKVLGGSKTDLLGAPGMEEEQTAEEEASTEFPLGLQDSHYAKAEPRLAPAQLPGLHSRDKVFLDEKTEKAFKEIYQGNFTLQTLRQTLPGDDDDDGGDDNPSYRYQVNAILFQEDAVSEEEKHQTMSRMCFQTNNQRTVTYIHLGFDDHFFTRLGATQRGALGYRLWHFFLRYQAGALLSESLFDFLALKLREQYTAHEYWWKEALDVAMIQADVGLSQGHHWQWQETHLNDYAQLLQANKLYSRAALIYQDMAYFVQFRESKKEQLKHASGLHAAAGEALASAGEFEKAVEQHILALNLKIVENARGEKLPWSSPGGADATRPMMLGNMVNIYQDWLLHFEADNDKLRVATTFVALLVLAKACHTEGTSFYQERLNEFVAVGWCPPGGAKAAVKPAFLSQKAAQRVLSKAVSKPCSLQKFHETVLVVSMVTNTFLNNAALRPSAADAKQWNKAFHKEMKERARSSNAFKGPAEDKIKTACNNEDCVGEHTMDSLLLCPCKIVGYCCKECQVADWKRHKKECPWQAEKKKKKSG